jgi:hypothetical protein
MIQITGYNTDVKIKCFVSHLHLFPERRRFCDGTDSSLDNVITVVPPYPRVTRSNTYRGCPKPRIVANPIKVNIRSTKVDAVKLKRKYLNRPWSTLAVNVLIFSVRSKPRITETADTKSADTESADTESADTGVLL